MQIMRLNGLAMLIFLVSVADDSIAIETNPFSSLTKVQGESIGLVYSVMDGHKFQWIASENGLFVQPKTQVTSNAVKNRHCFERATQA